MITDTCHVSLPCDIQNCHPAIWPIRLLEINMRYNKKLLLTAFVGLPVDENLVLIAPDEILVLKQVLSQSVSRSRQEEDTLQT